MIALIVFGVLLIYLIIVGLLIRVARKSPDKQNRLVAKCLAIAVVLIPLWDIPIDKYMFHQLCKKEGGIFVYQKTGLSKNYYLTSGRSTEKIFHYADGSSGRRKVEATGNELKIENLKWSYNIEDSTDYDYVSWGEVVKFTTTVSRGEKLLGKAVSFIGGAGWFAETVRGQRLPGKRCPVYPREPDRPSYRERLLYKIFYKLED
ncbi:MAG: hypothetical protein QNK32_01690 [Porticoccus sp.]|nr:hypothetical protein [Porticoccus sp.]